MARKPAAAEPSTELALFTSLTPVTIVTNTEKAEELFAHIEQQIAEFVPDLSTDAGRKAVASLAFKVTKTKTAITAAAEELIEQERKKVATTVSERKRIEERLDALRDKARAPLTAWEEREAKRAKAFADEKTAIGFAQIIAPSDTLEDVREQREMLWGGEYDPNSFGEEGAATLKVLANQAIEVLDAAIARMEQQERDRIELEQLRAERAEQARQDEERAAEQQRQADEAAAAQRAEEEAQRIADEERAAQEQAAENARLEAEAEQRRIEAAAEAAQVAERQRADQALEDQRKTHAAELQRIQDQQAAEAAARQADADRIARQQAEREAEEKRVAEENAARQADQDHRRKVKTDAKNAIMVCGADEQTARNIVLAIVGGDVPNVTINF